MTTVLSHPTSTRIRGDAELVQLVRDGRASAFDEIVARYRRPLTTYARQLLGGAHHDAEEAVQDVFVKALGALRKRPEREIVLKPWLYTIARNACLDRLRKPVRTVELAPLERILRDRDADPHAAVARREELRELVGDLRELPARQRAALVMHELEGRSHEQVARRLAVSVGGSKALVHRARQGMTQLREAA